ncbi:sensor histidine kinase [Reichenbachiella versicolor]|uniref:sensor histidine kinase n=1 Tax=Reichenbachiella versicolor TaxID=1821036 RepID=UPI000D6E64BC|nr:HAMP domain-containing sensor histidine kinase [Reichenbachiella versicolor]
MRIKDIVDFFIHPSYFNDTKSLRQVRLLVRTSFLTSLISNSYIYLSYYFEYDKGVTFMIANVVGFLLLPFLVKTRVHITIIGNFYTTIGAIAVITLTYFSGGMYSGIYPWIISIPILSLLVVGRKSAFFWGILALGFMIWFGWQAIIENDLPVEYNVEMRALWYTSVLTGLLMILLFITFVFEFNRSHALSELEKSNLQLIKQKNKITLQSEQLKEHINEKDFFIQILSHDLKNPLGNIESLFHLLQKQSLTADQKELVDLIHDSNQKATQLIAKVLDVSLSESKINVDLKATDVNTIITNCLNDFQGKADKKNILLKYRNGIHPKAHADATYLCQVIENLLSNAIKFSEKNKVVSVWIEQDEIHVFIFIKDQGPGFQPKEKKLMFSKFAQMSAKPTNGEGSTGLGLSLVKTYIEKMNGSIECDSKPNQGATFKISLPKV